MTSALALFIFISFATNNTIPVIVSLNEVSAVQLQEQSLTMFVFYICTWKQTEIKFHKGTDLF